MTYMFKRIAAPLALAAGIAAAAPAMAQTYSPREMQSEFNRLQDQIERIGETRRLTNSEYRSLLNRVDGLRQSYRQYGRDGFSRREVNSLSDRIDNVRQVIREQARDNDRLRR